VQLSIVIPVYNNWWLTARVLRELDRLRGSSAVSFETIVVDNASSDETPQAIAGFSCVRYERMERNTNFAGACNAGARLAQAPVVLFLNNDAYPLGDALAPLVRAFEREEVAIAGGALFFEDGATQAAGFVMLPNAHWHSYCRNLPPELDGVTQARDAIGVSGAAMAVRTTWFLENGGFEEDYVNGFEDVDLCMRAREAGLTIAYVANARFAHYEAASEGRFDREAANERRFYERWQGSLTAIPRALRGDVGAIAIASRPGMPSLLAAGLADLEGALRAFGHPLVRGAIRPWQRLDRRYRRGATLAWFSGDPHEPGIAIERRDARIGSQGTPAARTYGGLATIRTHGAASLEVPWLPCAAADRTRLLPLRTSTEASCATVALAGFDTLAADRAATIVAQLDEMAARIPAFRLAIVSQDGGAELLQRFGSRAERVAPLAANGRVASQTGAEPRPTGVACILHAGLTDESTFGNVLLAQGELATVALASDELRALFQPDVALLAEPNEIAASITRFIADPAARTRYAGLAAADARRRFSPRRSAIRTVDLLCAARFGLERAASNNR
jgi:GT2 family glycosyltransferase